MHRKPMRVNVGTIVEVRQLGRFTVGVNSRGILLWPDASIELDTVGQKRFHENLDKEDESDET